MFCDIKDELDDPIDMDITIREASEGDIHEILALINNELGYPDVSFDEVSTKIARMMEQGNYSIFVAVIDEKVVGFITVVQGIALEIRSDYFRILELAVSKAYQNKGIGKSPLRHIDVLAVEKGVSCISLSCGLHRTDAHAFYECNGYSKTSFAFAKGDKRK